MSLPSAFLTGRAGCSQPQSIEQARQDFRIYMSKLLEHSAKLHTLRSETRPADLGVAAAGSGGDPAWGPPVTGPSEEDGSVGGTKRGPSESGAPDVATVPSFSPSYFREKHAWPRAGAVTPPRPRPPPNFSWAAEPSTQGADSGAAGAAAAGRSLFSEFALSPGPPPREGEGERLLYDELARTGGRDGEEPEEGAIRGDEWKAEWSRRLSRGPIHSEYQDRFPWPPRSALRTSGAVGAPSIPSLHRRGRPRSARSGATTGAGDAGLAPPARSASPLPSTRRAYVSNSRGGGTGEEAGMAGARSESEPPRDRRAAGTVGHGTHPSSPAKAPDVLGGGNYAGRNDTVEAAAVSGTQGRRYLKGSVAAAAAASSTGGEQEMNTEKGQWAGGQALGSPAPSHGPYFPEWEMVSLREQRSDTRGSVHGGRERAGGREHVGGDGDLPSRAATEGGGVSVAGLSLMERPGDAGAGLDVLRKRAVGRGDYTTMPRGRTLDYSQHSILTEYMDEFAWPSTLPVPGRRGKRTGMGVDHVGRLLAGERAEEPRRVPDPGVVARLAAAADRALRAGSPGHLSEMCRLKSPSSTCRRLVMGLVVALGLRWRRWSDIRSHLLGNKPSLIAALRRFDMHRPGLTSVVLRPYAEDPNLAPAEVGRVAECLVWVSRWLRALYDYLAVREGNLADADAGAASLSRTTAAAAAGGGGGGGGGGGRLGSTSRRPRARSISSSHRGSLRGTGGVTGPASGTMVPGRGTGGRQRVAEEERGRSSGARVAAGRRTQHAAEGPRAAAVAADGGGGGGDDDFEGRDARTIRHPSLAAATRSDGSTCSPASTATGHGVERKVAAGGSRPDERGLGGRVGGGAAAMSVAGSGKSGGGSGDLDNESQWTAGTVTSRGNVLGAPTEDQVDVGSSETTAQHDKENEKAATARRKYNDDGGAGTSGGIPISSRGRVPSTAAATRAATAVSHLGMTSVVTEGARGSVRRGLSLGVPQRRSHSCIYRHQYKGTTPSRIANPKARRPTRARHDPILANTRWPPPVAVRAVHRTEQRSAFSTEHSLLAYE